MAKKATINVKTDESLKKQVDKIFKKIGLTSSDAINIFYHQVKFAKGLPFPVLIPNRLTAKTMTEVENAENINKYENLDAFFQKMGVTK